MPTSKDDDSLLARLNALKPTGVKFEAPSSTTSSHDEDDGGDDIARRFLGLRQKPSKVSSEGPGLGDEHAQDQVDEVEPLEEMLKELRKDQKAALAPGDEERVKILLSQANAALEEDTEAEIPNPPAENAKAEDESKVRSTQLDLEKDDGEEKTQDDGNITDEDAEADALLAQILDEVHLEGHTEHDEATTPDLPHVQDKTNVMGSSFDETLFPNTPSKEPETKPQPPSNELNLPSAPTTFSSKGNSKSSLRKYKDEEIETWCEICQANAEVRCLGCDGELYCTRCWKEGHTGPDAGHEVRQHRCVQYSKPGRPETIAAA